jgi:HAD superfamily hydrolase (TIGR01509 family)
VKLEGVVFDVDGVVAETENIHRMAYNAMFERVGIDVEWSPAEYAALLVQVGRTKLHPVVEGLDVGDKAAYAEELHGIKRGIYGEMLDRFAGEGTLVPRPGVVRLIREAVRNCTKLGLATVSPRESSARLLRHVLGESLLAEFAAFHTGCDVEHYKPAPDIYLQVVEQLGTDGARTVAIEDTQHGLESAKSAGLKCVVTPSEYTVGEEFEDADLVVSDLDHFSDDRPVDLAVLNGLVDDACKTR